MALGDARLARDLGGGLERREPPLRLREEPRAVALQLDLLERADHRLAEVRALPWLHEVAVDLAAVDGVDDRRAGRCTP